LIARAGAEGADLPTVDLQTHSTASDGSSAPGQVVEAARRAGLAAIALTDHDTIAGLPEAIAAGERLGVRVVTGVELSAYDGDNEIHLLGLHLEGTEELDRALRTFREARHRRVEAMVERLNALGVGVGVDDVLRYAAGGALGRPHVARALIEGGWARDRRDAFDRFLAAGRPAFVEKHNLVIGDAIALVHRAGGLAILAHPGAGGRRETIEPLVALGLDGIEVRHPGHSGEDVARLAALTEFFGLVPSGGSDWHGAPEGPRFLGCMKVPYAWLERQDERVRARRGAADRA
jgi:predicted metal-dependent phosphoesterase TrpH